MSRERWCLIAVTILVTLFVVWRLSANKPVPLQTNILYDSSPSKANPCDDVAAAAQIAIAASRQRKGSSVRLFATGDSSTSYEPTMASSQSTPTKFHILKGREEIARANANFVETLKHTCEMMPRARSSPIFYSVQTVVAQMKSEQQPGGQLWLLVITDLRETVERQIRAALRQRTGTKSRLPTPIDIAGIRVTICGFAETRDSRLIESERLTEVWTQLFTAAPQFEPFCPTSDTSEYP